MSVLENAACFVRLVRWLHGDKETVHRRSALITLSTGNEKHQEALLALSSAVCLVNHLYRDRELKSGAYVVSREDIFLSLSMLSVLLSPGHFLDWGSYVCLAHIRDYFREVAFSSVSLRLSTGYSRTQTARQLATLLRAGFIVRTGGHANRGYRYRLCAENAP